MSHSPSKSKQHKKKKDDGLPLLEEVNDLIEKERLLMTLKVLEQQKQAEEWKAKYELLVGKVGETSAKTGNFQTLEQVGNDNDDSDDKRNRDTPPEVSISV